MISKRSFLILLLSCTGIFAFAGIKSVGISFVENYPKEVYQAGTQTWSIDQDSRGVMYFGNNTGLLTFDSQNWRLYPVPNNSIVRSVKTGKEGRIYIGCFNDFGYFAPDERGELIYTSLLEKVPEEYRDFGEVWDIMFYESGIIFHSYDAVFYYYDNEISVISYNSDLHFSFNVDNNYLVKQNGTGILRLTDSGLELIRHSDFFANIAISAIFSAEGSDLLVFTREDGIFLLTEEGIRPFDTPLQDFFRTYQIFNAIAYEDDFYIVGTVQNGLLIIDREGNLVQHLNRNRGLQNNTILSLFTDKIQNLWLGLDNGIDFVMINSPLSYIATERDIGAAYVVAHQKENLYLGTNQGLYVTSWPYLPNLDESKGNYQFVDGSQGQVWSLTNMQGILLMGHDKGTFEVSDHTLRNLSNVQGGWTFVQTPDNPDQIIEGTYSGLLKYSLQVSDGKPAWNFERVLPGFSESCRQVRFDKRDYVWIGHGYKGVYRLKLNHSLDSIVEIRQYAENEGFPSHFELNVMEFNNQVIVSSNRGIFTYNYDSDAFEFNQDLTEIFGPVNVMNLIEDQHGNIWYFSATETGMLKSNFDGSFNKTVRPFNPIHQKVISNYEHVYAVDKSNILFSTEEGVIHFDAEFIKDYKTDFDVSIRQVEILPDSLIYGGYFLQKQDVMTGQEIKFRNNSLRFSYSAISYEFSQDNEYSYILEGFDENWSEWSLTAEKEYTNLHDGEYKFRVRARNVYGYESESEPYSFVILPPWYTSLLAYIIYIILFVILVIIIIRSVFRKIEKEKLALNEKQKADLKEREKQYEEESLKSEQEIIKLRNEKLEAENQKNLAELDSKTKELASVAMQITYKNELLTRIKQKLIKVSSKMLHMESKMQVDALIKTLEKDIITQDEWERFEVHFDQVHEDFIKKLRINYSELTPKDLRLCAYLRMNLSSKEIAPLLNISVRGVEISRYRLRKKMGLGRDANLTDFMMKL